MVKGACVAKGGMGGKGGMCGKGACMTWGMCGEGAIMVKEGMNDRGCAWWGACMAEGHAWLGGGGLCVAGETTAAVGGTHPTGMHSCFIW